MILRIWPAALVALHVLACLSGSAIDWLSVHVASLLIAAAVGLSLLFRCVSRPYPAIWFALALGWGLLLACHGPTLPPAPDLRVGVVGIDAAMFLAMLVTAGRPFAASIRDLGLGAAVGLLLSIGAALVMHYEHVGLGMMNHLLAFSIQAIVGWAMYAWPSADRRWRWWLIGGGAIVVAWAWFGHPDGPRRGALCSIALGILAPSLLAWAGRRPRTAVGLALAVLVVAVLLWQWAATQDAVREFRTQRVGIWLASWEGIRAWWPWGGGCWSSLRLSDLPADAARVVSTGNAAFDHPHNEVLAILQDHGAPGIVLAMAAALGLVVPLARLERSAMRDACVALLASTSVFLMFENAYSLAACRIMLGLTAGLVLAAIAQMRPPARTLGGPVMSLFVTGAVGLVLWSAWRELPAALLPRHPTLDDLDEPLRRSAQPQVAECLVELGVQAAGTSPDDRDLERLDQITGLAIRRFGPAPGLVRERFRIACILVDRFLRLPPGHRETTYGTRILVDEVCYLAERVLHADPFLVQPYQVIACFDRQSMADRGDQSVVRRARMLTGACPDAVPPAPPYGGLEKQADVWAYLTWRLAAGWRSDDHVRLSALLDQAGGSIGVVRLAVAVAAADPVGAAAWLPRHQHRLSAAGIGWHGSTAVSGGSP